MYLSFIHIENYKGIKNLDVSFQKDINVIIGENGSHKTALIDSIRLLYNLGKQQREIYVTTEDFYVGESVITITYEFRGLTPDQKGAFYEYIVLGENEGEDFARITISYKRENQRIYFSYYSGEVEGQKADNETFQFFIHYYLGALRDSTRDLLTPRNNILGNLINRQVEINKSQDSYETLIKEANEELLKLKEVVDSRQSINLNLTSIYRQSVENQIGLRIEESRAEYIVNIIKPYLPYDVTTLTGEGFNLKQNSLGFNNLIYIATVLGDISQQLKGDSTSHYTLLIEEPEAHLHPQLQLNLYEFLKQTNSQENSQLFITTHSPTLTSKVPLDNLIHLSKGGEAVNIYKCFEKRESVTISEPDEETYQDDPMSRKSQLERYIDVTKSQLFFSKGVLFVEGISEELLVPVFGQILNKKLEDYKVELVNAGGTSFYPIIYLFNSTEKQRTLPIPLAILTDDDRYPESKNTEYSFKNLKDDLVKTEELFQKIKSARHSTRIGNIQEIIKSTPTKISLNYSFKTFEFAVIQANITKSKTQITNNLLWKYLSEEKTMTKKFNKIKLYLDGISGADLSETELGNLQILTWKALPSKSEFAQNLSLFLQKKLVDARTHFNVPEYIERAITHLTTYK
ncbi:MAG: AAA family ATPase [Cytophagales bacterium]|nr:AAA family ATPase [Cytophagales bacterium]MCA6369750.1 AAA family ATPase [Cytophagales bacterium]MCA6377280.1 AAA family ATPase [Cytophagales bacterium]MCA6386088.1 AAA family ATPase [Cytophagales bacterium]